MPRAHVISHVETGRMPHWRAAAWSGILGGVIFFVLETVFVPLFSDAGAWTPMRMIGAILLGRDALPPPATFEMGIFLAAVAVHFALAVVYGLILSVLVFRFEVGAALAIGALFGVALYLINFYVFTGAFPWFAEARNWISIVAHIVFGVSVAWIYKGMAQREIEQEALK